MKIEFIESPDGKDIAFLTHQIDEDIEKLGRFDKIKHFGFFIKNSAGEILGGCNCYTVCGAMHIDQLWVHELLRGQGYGRKLMESVHEYSRSIGLSMTTVDTMDFQGKRGFYEHLGYSCDLERSGYNGGTRLFFKKDL